MRRLLVLRCATFALMPGPAGAQQDALPVDVELSAGFQGLFVPGRPVPVRAGISSESLAAGQLSLSTQMGPIEAIDFELAGGGTAEHWALPDAPMQDNTPITATADGEGRGS